MKCRECGTNMFIDDRDWCSQGNYDNYWCCEKCLTSCIELVRFGKSIKQFWHSENDGVKDYIVYRKDYDHEV